MVAASILFVSHGAPTVALEDDAYTRALRGFAGTLSMHGSALEGSS